MHKLNTIVIVKNPAPNKAPISKLRPSFMPPATNAAITSVDPFANAKKVAPANDWLTLHMFDSLVTAGVKYSSAVDPIN
jgi:hypothetical protein